MIYYLVCKNEGCREPILLRDTTPSESGVRLPGPPNYGSSVVVLCPHCKLGNRYSSDEVVPEESPSNHGNNLMANEVLWSTTIGCVTEGCPDPLYRVLSIVDKHATKSAVEELVHAAASSIFCRHGHPLPSDRYIGMGPTEPFLT